MKSLIRFTQIMIILFATTACTTPKMVDKQFGNSVRNMVKQQVHDPATLRNPPQDSVSGQNSQKAMLDQHKIYRTSDVSKQSTKAFDKGS